MKIVIAAKQSSRYYVSALLSNDESGLLRVEIIEHDKKPAAVLDGFTMSSFLDCLTTSKTEQGLAKDQHRIIFENLDSENNLIKSIESELKNENK